MPLQKTPSPQPAASAARLLRRVGFFVLAAAPLLSMASRRGFVIAVPFGSILVIMATLIESETNKPWQSIGRMAVSICGIAGLFVLLWAGLSLIWTPFKSEAMARLANMIGLVVLVMTTVASLPVHSRASNLHVLPIGLGGAIVLANGLSIWSLNDPDLVIDPLFTERLPLFASVLLFPCIGWLHSRQRFGGALMLLVFTGSFLILHDAYAALFSLTLGIVFYGLAVWRATWCRWLSGMMTIGLLVLAPVLPFVLRPLTKWAFGATDLNVDALRAWGRLVQREPLRLMTGHGFDVTARAKAAGLIEPTAPRGLLFELWYDLGLLGVVGVAIVLLMIIRASSKSAPVLAPGILATLICAFSLTVLGQVALQSWWVTLIGLVVIMWFAIEQGQYHTIRPRSISTRSH
jgi:hypothetical protein